VKDLRLLVVEDEAGIAQFLKKSLSERDYSVVAVGDHDAALSCLEADRFDLLILDPLLPGTRDGVDLCRELRPRGIPVKVLP
jgi:DNA-binding response OmpR family regulator